MTDLQEKAMRMSLERLESHEYWMDEEAIQALRTALEESANSTTDFVEPKTSSQPEQEPVAWVCRGVYSPTGHCPECQPLYTAPPKQWVGLTDADIDAYALDEGVTADKAPPWLVKYARDIEVKLKEKNT